MKRLLNVLLIVGALVSGAATAFAQDAEKPPMERKASSGPFAEHGGEWQSEWGTVYLLFENSQVKGEWKDGRLEGKVDDAGNITYKWVSLDGTAKGHGVFVIQKNGRIVGSWGFGSSANNGGEWTLTRS